MNKQMVNLSKELDEIYNNELFNYILKTKGITEKKWYKEKEDILKYYQILKQYDMNNNIDIKTVLLYLYLDKSLSLLDNNIKDIKINNKFNINQNKFKTNIGNIVVINDEKIGIFLGTFPKNINISKELNNKNEYIIEINFIDHIPYIYSFEDEEIISGLENWWESLPEQMKLKNKIKEYFKKENIEKILKDILNEKSID